MAWTIRGAMPGPATNLYLESPMESCQPIPCPDFTNVKVTIDAVCDCLAAGHSPSLPGSPDCPIHGERVKGYIQGWNAASDAFDYAARQVAKL